MKSCLLGLLVLGCQCVTAGAASPEPGQISYEVKILDFEGIGWRQKFHYDLDVVSFRGTTTVWTLDPAKIPAFCEAGQSVAAPKVTALDLGPVMIQNNASTRYYVQTVKRVSDGPRFEGTRVAFRPLSAKLTEGCTVNMTGRLIDQGVLAKVKIDSLVIEGFQVIQIADGTRTDTAKGVKGQAVAAQIQLPFLYESHVDGEWLIPKDGALVVGMGYSHVGGNSKLHEQVAVITAKRVLTEVEEEAIKPAPLKQAGTQIPANPARAVGDIVVVCPTAAKDANVKIAQSTVSATADACPAVEVATKPKGKFTVGFHLSLSKAPETTWTRSVPASQPVNSTACCTLSEALKLDSSLKEVAIELDPSKFQHDCPVSATALNMACDNPTPRSTVEFLANVVELVGSLVAPPAVAITKVDSSVKQVTMDRGKGFEFELEIPLNVERTARKAPALPSRNLPLAIDTDGKVIDLPPLPDSAAKPAAFDEEGNPMATPQAGQITIASPGDAFGKAFFGADAGAKVSVKMQGKPGTAAKTMEVFDGQAKLDAEKLARLETQTILVPFSNGMAIEIQAKLVPAVK